MEKQLDQIKIGNVKMNVNIPKFERPQVAFSKDEGGTSYRAKEREPTTLYEMEGDTGKANHEHKERQLITQSFVEVMKGQINTKMKTWKPRCGKQALEEEKKWWEMELNIQRSNLDRLNNCWVGHLRDLSLFDRL